MGDAGLHGMSTLGVAQLESTLRDPNFLGTVTLAGASDLEDGIDSAVHVDQPILNGLIAFIVFGAMTVYPELEPGDILTDPALALYHTFVADGCSAAAGAFIALPSNGMLKPGWKANKFMHQFLARDRPGTQPVRGPFLLATGGADVMFTETAAQKVFRRLCTRGERVQWNVYPGLGHDPVVYGSLRDQLALDRSPLCRGAGAKQLQRELTEHIDGFPTLREGRHACEFADRPNAPLV
jgi:hypothetical protein